ncbi:MAG: peptidase M24 [Anaerolineae bacterium UTCFX2]|jgi:Xaa-Pro dipeptidase|nr:Xaa-Pro peptidase family protein [Anaerolineales bacterium]OQY92315.1 MAG: peptidase M24 [Anaerolineae bacterium UTCFX2]
MHELDFSATLLARQQRLAQNLSANSLDHAVINPGPTLTYLTGLSFHLMERPVVAFFSAGGQPALVLPELETAKLSGLPGDFHPFAYGEDPAAWLAVFRKAAEFAGLDGSVVGVEPARLRFLELSYLQDAAPTARFVSAAQPLADLRICKDAQEIDAMRRAVQIAQQALQAVLPMIGPGVTERQVASELVIQLFRAGSQTELPFAPIVASGPNSANPHAVPSNRPLQTGDLLVIDWGASADGYISDLTRTFAIGGASPEYQRVAKLVKQANQSGRDAAGPGVPAEAVDWAARRLIAEAGYGEYFTHRTGHGIGMEGHEEPYIREGNRLILQSGMAFTVEPGIYLPGRGGVRIEDNVVVTATGAECLSDLPRELIVLG